MRRSGSTLRSIHKLAQCYLYLVYPGSVKQLTVTYNENNYLTVLAKTFETSPDSRQKINRSQRNKIIKNFWSYIFMYLRNSNVMFVAYNFCKVVVCFIVVVYVKSLEPNKALDIVYVYNFGNICIHFLKLISCA